jgi:copper chaperone CopZ
MMVRLAAMRRLAGAVLLGTVVLLAGAGAVLPAGPAAGSPSQPGHAVTLAVDRLKGGCPSCACIADRALSHLDGVVRVGVSARTGTAVVVFDPERTDVDALTQATAAVGFPAAPLE